MLGKVHTGQDVSMRIHIVFLNILEDPNVRKPGGFVATGRNLIQTKVRSIFPFAGPNGEDAFHQVVWHDNSEIQPWHLFSYVSLCLVLKRSKQK